MRVSRALCLRHEAPELCRAFTRQDLHLCITPSIFSSSGSAPRNARCRLLDLLEDVREAAHGRGRVADSRAARLCLGLGCWLFCRWRASVPWPSDREQAHGLPAASRPDDPPENSTGRAQALWLCKARWCSRSCGRVRGNNVVQLAATRSPRCEQALEELDIRRYDHRRCPVLRLV